jgi:hypothetical protein
VIPSLSIGYPLLMFSCRFLLPAFGEKTLEKNGTQWIIPDGIRRMMALSVFGLLHEKQ